MTEFAHDADCDGPSFETLCVGCEHAKQMRWIGEIERLHTHIVSLLAMPAACVTDEEVAENIRRRELARADISGTGTPG